MVDRVRLGYTIAGLICRFMGVVRSCCDLILAGEPVEDRSAADLVVGEVGRWWGLGIGLSQWALAQRPVWSWGSEMVQVDPEDPA